MYSVMHILPRLLINMLRPAATMTTLHENQPSSGHNTPRDKPHAIWGQLWCGCPPHPPWTANQEMLWSFKYYLTYRFPIILNQNDLLKEALCLLSKFQFSITYLFRIPFVHLPFAALWRKKNLVWFVVSRSVSLECSHILLLLVFLGICDRFSRPRAIPCADNVP